MQVYRIVAGGNLAALTLADAPVPVPTGRQVRVRVRAVSLNYRDLMVAQGNYLVSSGHAVVPCSDAAGEVVAVGPDASRFKPGDRVMASFFPHWVDGPPTPAKGADALGAVADGVLAEEVVLREDALVAMPAHLDFVQASTLPCAGVTAWNTLFGDSRLKPGATVLLLGTGGVSIWALQLAKAAGLKAIITSSSDAKLERARALGADATINYRSQPQWDEEVLRLTAGTGADVVLEVGGQETLARSVAATRMGGRIAIIGGVSGFGGPLDPMALIGGAKSLQGIFVGSRSMLEDLSRFVEAAGIRPVVDRVFGFHEARAAYEYLAAGRHFGKVAIRVGS